MAEKRMFTKKITETDAFQDMPLSAQALYFHFNMNADDDGFVGNPKRIMRMVGAAEDDLKLLIIKRFVIAFDRTGIIVIKHWRMHNTLRQDRYHPTEYQEELNMLGLKKNGAYTERLDCPEIIKVFADDNKTKVTDGGCGSGNQLATSWQPSGNADIGLDIDIDLDKGLDLDSNSAEPEQNVVITLICNDGYEYPVTEEFVNQMQELYPAADVMQELRGMKAWCISNPQKRKTKSGINRFVNSWLSKVQNKGGSYRNNGGYVNGTGSNQQGRYGKAGGTSQGTGKDFSDFKPSLDPDDESTWVS